MEEKKSISVVNDSQLELFPAYSKEKKSDLSSTFGENMSLPIHRWFRYSAGFSASWVRDLIRSEKEVSGREIKVIDPFAGSGTVLIESELENVSAYGIEAHPFVFRMAEAKLLWNLDPNRFKEYGRTIIDRAKSIVDRASFDYPKLIKKCYPQEEVLKKLDSLKRAWEESSDNENKKLAWLLITSILRISSPVGTAQWQYVLPNKTKNRSLDPFQAIEFKLREMVSDMRTVQAIFPSIKEAEVLFEDARNIESIPENWGNLVITSPPYANNYDYADATRLEMTFWREIESWGDLQEKVRKYLIRACTQHVSKLNGEIEAVLASEILYPIKNELIKIYDDLSVERMGRGGKKNYHLMIAAYFKDLGEVFHQLRRVTQKGSTKMCFVIGDSAPYGIYVPVDKWLGELAVSAGFDSFEFEKLRDRNTKWKNRKHTVPLKEGRLWING